MLLDDVEVLVEGAFPVGLFVIGEIQLLTHAREDGLTFRHRCHLQSGIVRRCREKIAQLWKPDRKSRRRTGKIATVKRSRLRSLWERGTSRATGIRLRVHGRLKS